MCSNLEVLEHEKASVMGVEQHYTNSLHLQVFCLFRRTLVLMEAG